MIRMNSKFVMLAVLMLALAWLSSRVADLGVVTASPYSNVDVQTAYNMINNGSFPNLVVLDVRSQSEFESGHLYGAIWIPVEELEARVEELLKHQDHEIIIYCRSGVRSVNASKILDSNNFTKAYNMVGGILEWQSNGYPVGIATVRNINTSFSYDTIQAAIDALQTLDGHTLLVGAGTYYEHVTMNKSVSLVGENRSTTIIDGNNTGITLLVTSDSVSVRGFTVRNGDSGIYIVSSYGCIVERNDVRDNRDRGILISQSENCTVSHNVVQETRSGYGINVNDSKSVLVEGNTVTGNYFDGIGLLNSNNCIVQENMISGNYLFGIWVDSSNHNVIYHNNVFNNGIPATSNSGPNTWDNGFEGNYWGDYVGVDLDHDGLGDQTYEIDVGNVDRYPFMGMFSSFNTSQGHQIYVISNSTINELQYVESNQTIKMYISNTTATQTHGFCRVAIPHELMNMTNIQVIIDGGSTQVLYQQYALIDNGTHRWIYFAYEHSTLEVEIIPEFTRQAFLAMLVATFSIGLLISRRNKRPS